MTTILVTGACGYIGSHIVRLLQKNPNNHIIAVDWVERLHTLKQVPVFYNEDYIGPNTLNALDDGVDYLIHCAGTSLVGPSVLDPGEYYTNNVVKTIKLLEYIKKLRKWPVVIFSSSASVYGNSKVACRENSPLNPISPYGNTKWMIEKLLKDYADAYGIRSVIFRYFNAAGAEPFNFNLGQELGATHIVARVVEANVYGGTFTLNGTDYNTEDGTCVRDYVHVWDIVRAHAMAIQYMAINDEKNLTLNLGTRMGISNKQIVDWAQGHFLQQPGRVKYEYGPRRPGDPDKLVADARKAKAVLGWEPQFSSIETIMHSAYEWYNHRKIM